MNNYSTNNSSHCEKNAMKAAVCLLSFSGDTAINGLDKHGNKDKDWWCSVDNPGRNAGLLLGSKFL